MDQGYLYPNRSEAFRDARAYIVTWHNSPRPYSTLDYKTRLNFNNVLNFLSGR